MHALGAFIAANTILVIVALAVIGIAAMFLGQGTLAALIFMILGGVLIWQSTRRPSPGQGNH